jgi:hypothetical protein
MATDKPLVVRRHIRFSAGERGRKRLRAASTSATPRPAAAVPRISRLVALAVVFDEMVRTGRVTSYAELATLARVSRSRLVQIMSLVNLAPDLQEALLFLAATGPDSDHPTERQLRQVVAATDWEAQRSLWRGLTHPTAASPPVL